MKQKENSSCCTAVVQPLPHRSGHFSPNLKCGLKGRDFYSTQEKRKIAEQFRKFFPNPVRKVGKLKNLVPVFYIKPLKTKCRPLYLKTQFVPRSKYFSSRL
jgi:hypothetical protein